MGMVPSLGIYYLMPALHWLSTKQVGTTLHDHQQGVGHQWHCSCVQNRSKSWIKQVFLYVLMFFWWIYTWYYTFYELHEKKRDFAKKILACWWLWNQVWNRSPDLFSASGSETYTAPKKKPLANGYGSKPWYLVNPKIAGKWMFIPLKMCL